MSNNVKISLLFVQLVISVMLLTSKEQPATQPRTIVL